MNVCECVNSNMFAVARRSSFCTKWLKLFHIKRERCVSLALAAKYYYLSSVVPLPQPQFFIFIILRYILLCFPNGVTTQENQLYTRQNHNFALHNRWNFLNALWAKCLWVWSWDIKQVYRNFNLNSLKLIFYMLYANKKYMLCYSVLFRVCVV